MTEQVPCARPGCGHVYGAHDPAGWCDTWQPEGGRVVRCRCSGFLWVDPAGPSPTYGRHLT